MACGSFIRLICPNETFIYFLVSFTLPQVQEIARSVTKISNTTEAVAAFQKILKNRTLSYFNDKEIPENQTTGDAPKKCKSIETAKKYCPDRWAAMEKWFAMSRRVKYSSIRSSF